MEREFHSITPTSKVATWDKGLTATGGAMRLNKKLIERNAGGKRAGSAAALFTCTNGCCEPVVGT